MFPYRRRCCRMAMLSGSRRRDGSNATASTRSFFFLKLPTESRQESEHSQRFTRSCVEADHCSLFGEKLENFSPRHQTHLKKHRVKKNKKQQHPIGLWAVASSTHTRTPTCTAGSKDNKLLSHLSRPFLPQTFPVILEGHGSSVSKMCS